MAQRCSGSYFANRHFVKTWATLSYSFDSVSGIQISLQLSAKEYKMHVYLLVNVLLLGITVALWCQGKLPHTTPAPLKEFESPATGQKLRKRHYALMSQVWLMTGSALAMAGSFSFILLSIWMAMHPGFGKQVLVDRCPSLLEHSGLPLFEAFRRYGGRKGSAFQAVQSASRTLHARNTRTQDCMVHSSGTQDCPNAKHCCRGASGPECTGRLF